MLVLGRRVGEEICINEDIRIVVVAIRGNQVRLGLSAPRDVRIRRSEIADRDATAAESAEAPNLSSFQVDVTLSH